MFNRISQENDPQGWPRQKDKSKANWNEPVQRRQLVVSPKDDMQWRCIDDKHAETRSSKDSGEVPFIGDNPLPEGVGETGFHSEHLCTICEDRIK